MTISQGEIWEVAFYPQVGSEITRLRPAVIISHDTIGRLPLKTIVPITDWKPNYANYPWMIRIDPSPDSGLSKPSAVDCFQVKNFANDRFHKRIGTLPSTQLEHIHATLVKTMNPLYTLHFSH